MEKKAYMAPSTELLTIKIDSLLNGASTESDTTNPVEVSGETWNGEASRRHSVWDED